MATPQKRKTPPPTSPATTSHFHHRLSKVPKLKLNIPAIPLSMSPKSPSSPSTPDSLSSPPLTSEDSPLVSPRTIYIPPEIPHLAQQPISLSAGLKPPYTSPITASHPLQLGGGEKFELLHQRSDAAPPPKGSNLGVELDIALREEVERNLRLEEEEPGEGAGMGWDGYRDAGTGGSDGDDEGDEWMVISDDESLRSPEPEEQMDRQRDVLRDEMKIRDFGYKNYDRPQDNVSGLGYSGGNNHVQMMVRKKHEEILGTEVRDWEMIKLERLDGEKALDSYESLNRMGVRDGDGVGRRIEGNV